tara:strand:+ start:2129 stop:2455 length:327 start_codon:yes stop_codon:yes gene_type:complete
MGIKKPLEGVPRGTLIVSLLVAWGLLTTIFGFVMNDVWDRLGTTEDAVHATEVNIAKMDVEHIGFRDGMQRLEEKLDKVLYKKLGIIFGEENEMIYITSPSPDEDKPV